MKQKSHPSTHTFQYISDTTKILTIEAVIADKPEPEKAAMPDMGGMGGMR